MMMMLTVMVMVDGDDNGDLAKARHQVEGKKHYQIFNSSDPFSKF